MVAFEGYFFFTVKDSPLIVAPLAVQLSVYNLYHFLVGYFQFCLTYAFIDFPTFTIIALLLPLLSMISWAVSPTVPF
jgi:hypothetical protein